MASCAGGAAELGAFAQVFQTPLQTESPVPSPLVTFGQPLSSQVIQVADHNGDHRPDLAVSGSGISWLGSAASFNVTPSSIVPPEDVTSTSGIAF